ncbi:MAG TPA: transglutaminase family protein [Calditrichia bacterium]|nr:transglutaminase family protein [Calditrichia bacterium]
MKFSIVHHTRYHYQKAVFLEPHLVRLRPACDATQHLESFRLRVVPEPAGQAEYVDLDGNSVTQLWFEGTTSSLQIEATSLVETRRTNPFDFLLDKSQISALGYHPELFPFFDKTRRAQGIHPTVRRLARKLAGEAGGEVLQFLNLLNAHIAGEIAYVSRATGMPHPAELTLAEGRGACRDVAVLFIDCCRVLGIPARFVSGYSESAVDEEGHELHAWAEVCLPGGGWRGYDPSSGLLVADRHVAVARAYLPLGAAPVTGTIRGDGAIAELSTRIRVGG